MHPFPAAALFVKLLLYLMKMWYHIGMIENNTTEITRAVAAAADCGDFDIDRSLAELARLADTAGAVIEAELVQKLPSPDSSGYLGAGKLQELRELCEQLGIDTVIVNDELSPAQLRNMEQATELTIIDRTTLILDIFALGAVTAEGKLQVERAQLEYRLPRLVRSRSLSRLGGGIGTRGPGESKLESDRRHIRRRIKYLDDHLAELSQRRGVTRQSRLGSGIPTVSLVGYTNVGKSSLLNAITGSDALAQDRLFATLSPTMRRTSVGDLHQIVLADTVGFVSRLPHSLVEAFKSTLEEIRYSDLLLLVADASDPTWPEQLEVTKDVISQLGCADIPTLTVFNKCDKLCLNKLPGIMVSAKTGEGLPELAAAISHELESRVIKVELLLPYNRMELCAEIRARGNLHSESYEETGVRISATIDKRFYYRVQEYIWNG